MVFIDREHYHCVQKQRPSCGVQLWPLFAEATCLGVTASRTHSLLLQIVQDITEEAAVWKLAKAGLGHLQPNRCLLRSLPASNCAVGIPRERTIILASALHIVFFFLSAQVACGIDLGQL